ncbi:MAG: hypothetical protein DSZ28_00085 [Thiothrix sp.]|nr:MAG: hypothetical protein DSZ28_00085 [Thiothrix sp.]
MIPRNCSSVDYKTPRRSLLNIQTIAITALLSISSAVLAESPFITYDLQHEILAHDNPEPLLSIYENGKARAVYPEFMKKAGVYEWQLTKSELLELRKLAGKPGIQEFDEQAVQEKVEEKDKQDNTLISISDSTTTLVEVKTINESGEVIEGSATSGGDLQSIAFDDVPDMAEQNPEVTELVELDSLQSRLEAILDQANQSNRTQ